MIYLVSPNDDRNYGAVLQATALQDFLFNMGYESRFITIRKNLDSVLDIDAHSIKSLVKSLFVVLYKKELSKSCSLFDSFVKEHQKCTEMYESYQELSKNAPKGEAYIVGSDQIWPETNLLPLNKLSFAPSGHVKISYAASVGKDSISQEKKEEFHNFLESFSAVSIREKSAIPAFKQVYKKDIEYHVDPTLLFPEEYWMSKEKKYCGKLPSKYVLLYFIYTPKDINRKLKELRQKTHLPIVLISNTPYKSVHCDFYIRDAGPAEFLWLVHHAEGVVASSFHGCVFSIIYRKPLIAVNNPSKRARLDNLLELFNMRECMVWDSSFLENRRIYNDQIDIIIANEIERSKGYFRKYLG